MTVIPKIMPSVLVRPLLKKGLHPAASDALRSIGVRAELIGQTVGGAEASAGTHLADGRVNLLPYACATDFHVAGMTDASIRHLLVLLASVGYCGFYRLPGHDHWPEADAEHLHAVWAGAPMKPVVQGQIHDWMGVPMRNGLASHAEYLFWQPTAAQREPGSTLFLKNNPGSP